MRKLIHALLITLASAFPADAQGPTVNMPPNTVWGRLGIPTQGGPGQSIPFAVLLNALTAATNAIQNSALAQMPGNTVKCNNTGSTATPIDCTASQFMAMPLYAAPGTGAAARGTGSKLGDIVSVLDYGADPTGVADSTTAFQNAVNAVTTGGIVLVPGAHYAIVGTVTISNSLTLLCSNFLNASFGTINASGSGNTILAITAVGGPVTIRDCYFNRAGATVGDAIDIGVGVTGAGVFNATLDNVTIVNHAVGINIGNASEYKIINSKVNATNCFLLFNHVSQGSGASHISGNECLAGAASSGAIIHSGSDVRFVNNKFLQGLHAFDIEWDQSAEGNLIITNSSIEGFTLSAIHATYGFAFERIIIANNSIAGTGSGQLLDLDNASSVGPTNLIVSNNTMKLPTFAGVGISVGKVTTCAIIGNTIDFGGTGTGIALLSNSSGCVVGENPTVVGTVATNAGTNNAFNMTNPFTFATVPAGMANGSTVFISDADPATSPCTHAGAQTGARAFRQNGALKCF